MEAGEPGGGSQFEVQMQDDCTAAEMQSAAERFDGGESFRGQEAHTPLMALEDEDCFYQGHEAHVPYGDAHFEDDLGENTLHMPGGSLPDFNDNPQKESQKNDSGRVVKIQTSGFGKVVHNLLRQARDKITFRELLEGCKKRVQDVIAVGGEERNGRGCSGKDRRVSFRAESVAQASEFRTVFQEFQQLARALPVSPTPVEALLMQVTTGQGSIMHFEDALRLQQEDSEQRKGKKKGKPLTVSGGTQLAGLVLEKGAELQVENELLKKKLKELQEAVSNANTRALRFEKDKKELQEIIAKKKLVIRKQRASFLCDLAVEKRKRSKLKMKHAVAIAQYARRLKHVVTTLTTHNTKLAKEADCSRKAKESRKKELQQQKALEASQPRKKVKRNQERDGEVLVEKGATEEAQRPAEGRPKAARRRRRESPLTDPGDPPVALGPNARLLAAYSTPGGLLHAAGFDPGFASPVPNVVGGQLPGAPETTGTGSGEVRPSLGFVPLAPGLQPPGMPAWSSKRQPPVSLVPNGTVKGKRRKVVRENGDPAAQPS